MGTGSEQDLKITPSMLVVVWDAVAIVAALILGVTLSCRFNEKFAMHFTQLEDLSVSLGFQKHDDLLASSEEEKMKWQPREDAMQFIRTSLGELDQKQMLLGYVITR